MKKIVSIIAVIAMLCASSTAALAATVTLDGTKKSDSHDVMAQYSGGVATPDVYSVDVNWGAMEFTYNASGTRDWIASDHSYKDNSSASWSANGNTVTVTNHSNTTVTASFGFTALADYSATITGRFDHASALLPSAVDKALTDATLTATSTLTLLGTVSGSLTDFTEIGSVTVTIE